MCSTYGRGHAVRGGIGRRFIDSDLEAVLLKRIREGVVVRRPVFSKQLRDVGTIHLRGPKGAGSSAFPIILAAAKRLPPLLAGLPAFDLALRHYGGPGTATIISELPARGAPKAQRRQRQLASIKNLTKSPRRSSDPALNTMVILGWCNRCGRSRLKAGFKAGFNLGQNSNQQQEQRTENHYANAKVQLSLQQFLI